MDPYDALGIAFGATDAEISKAYKKKALKLHPDKVGKQNLSPIEAKAVAKQFHDIQQAKSFLLDAEHAEDRRSYDAKRESTRLRREAEERNMKTMSEQRKRMRQELKEKEAMAAAKGSKESHKYHQEKDLVDQLKRDGQKLREVYAEQTAQQELERELKEQRKTHKEALEARQIRLKWDRKKIKISPSEHSIATLLTKKIGNVTQVEILGPKGNQALVTFELATSCRPCVDAYATSKEMRAKFVGKRKQQEEELEDEQQQQQQELPPVSTTSRQQQRETLEDRRLRQGAEREELLRQMEAEEETVEPGHPKRSKPTLDHTSKEYKASRPFPIPMPDTQELENLAPIQKLQVLERSILGNLLSPEQLQSIQISRSR